VAKTIERSALVEQTPVQMFALVNDIANYPQFMDGCIAAEVVEQSDKYVTGRLDIRKGGFEQSFVTRNTLYPFERIDMQLVEGPFEQLDGQWLFQPIGEIGCRVSLTLTFQFKNRLIALAGNPWIESVGNQLVDSVCQRARSLYAK
jgi:ribosome-associated toxin RatA of RatAB toxin-antitoxin module